MTRGEAGVHEYCYVLQKAWLGKAVHEAGVRAFQRRLRPLQDLVLRPHPRPPLLEVPVFS